MKPHLSLVLACAWLLTVVFICGGISVVADDTESGGLIVFGLQHPSGDRYTWGASTQADFFQLHPGAIMPVAIFAGTEEREVLLELVHFVCPMRLDKTAKGCKRLLPGDRLVIEGCEADTINGYWTTRFATSK